MKFVNIFYESFHLSDPGNDVLPFIATIDVSKLITVEDVMENLNLGPNGALVYSMEFLEKNVDWLFTEIEKFHDHYFIFDLPGQVFQISNLFGYLLVLLTVNYSFR